LLKIAEAAPDAASLIDETYFEFCAAALTCRTMIPTWRAIRTYS